MLTPPDQSDLLPRLLLGHAPGAALDAAWGLALVLFVFLPAVSVIGFIAIWAERKVAGRMQHRHGPNRVGPFGLLQSLADGIKLATKEDLVPARADHWLFKLAPYLAFAPVFTAFMAIPFGPDFTFEPRLSAGLFWALAILGVEVIGVILAGWASNNKWSMYGAMREACQLISYEIPLGISILVVVVSAGALDMRHLTWQQAGSITHWNIFHDPFSLLAFFVFFIASLASNKRAPFDLPESDSELVAGYHTEYSGLRFSLFYLAEYAAMFVMGGIITALYLGGWADPLGLLARRYASLAAGPASWELMALNTAAVGIFAFKTAFIVFVQMWVRWTLPRPRIDQVLHACLKVLMPLALALLLGAALWTLLVAPDSIVQRITETTMAALAVACVLVALGYCGLAFVQGRGDRYRLGRPWHSGGV